MSIGIHINSRRNILRFELGASWTWDDLYQAVIEAETLFRESSTEQLSVIFDFSNSDALPDGATIRYGRLLYQIMANACIPEIAIIFVNASGAVQGLVDLLTRHIAFIEYNIFYVDGLTDAYALIAGLRIPKNLRLSMV
jgi:hypothetical protein